MDGVALSPKLVGADEQMTADDHYSGKQFDFSWEDPGNTEDFVSVLDSSY